MNKPRDPKGRYIKTKPKLLIKVPSNLFGGRNTPPINFAERYQKVGDSSTQRAKKVSEETKIGETIEQTIETSAVVGHEALPIEPSSEPANTTFSFSPPLGDTNFVDIIDLKQVNSLFGSSANIVVSQVETTTLEPVVSTRLSKVLDIQIVDKYSYRRNTLPEKEPWDTLLSSRIKPFRYSIFGSQISMDD
jgi:hypothetical protein